MPANSAAVLAKSLFLMECSSLVTFRARAAKLPRLVSKTTEHDAPFAVRSLRATCLHKFNSSWPQHKERSTYRNFHRTVPIVAPRAAAISCRGP